MQSSMAPGPFKIPQGLMRKIIMTFILLPALSGYAEDQTYENPVDKKAYTAPGGWQTHSPEGGVHPSADHVSLDSVRLLQAEQEIASRTTVAETRRIAGT